jgi:hypothetical protein
MRYSTFVTLAMAMAGIASAIPVDPITEPVPPAEETEEYWEQFLLPEAEAVPILNETHVAKRSFFGKTCKTMPGDLFWPGNLGWAIFDLAVGGRLIKPKPAGRVCHNSFYGENTYDAAACSQMQANWYDPNWQ